MIKYLSFLFPYDIRNIKAPYLWLMYKQLEKISPNNICFIGSKEYFLPKEYYKKRWEKRFSPEGYEKSSLIIHKKIIDKDIFQPLEKEKITANMVWKSLIKDNYQPLQDKLNKIISELNQNNKIEAIFTLCNCATLEKVAQNFNIPVIHVELGALRKPQYINTGYFDFKGVNGHTECETRYNKFIKEDRHNELVLNRKDLIDIITQNKSNNLLSKIKQYLPQKQFDLGIPMQVEDDSNMIAYSNNFNNFELLSHCRKYFDNSNILVRKHPMGRADYKIKNIDKSKSSKEFIYKCKNIATINSSVGLEALIYGKKTWIFGDNPFKYIAEQNPFFIVSSNNDYTSNIDKMLSFAVLGYLVPFDLLFEPNYISFRLSTPSEYEIYKYHLNYWRNSKDNL